MKKLICLLFFSILFNKVYSQIDVPVPQTYDFVKEGITPTNTYTGKLSLSIPIFNYRNKFNINVSYNSEGFKPNKRESEVGLNWHLNVGGVISRRVRGIADEHIEPFATSPIKRNGFYQVAKTKEITKEQFESCKWITHFGEIPVLKYNNQYYETESDEYVFNVNGLSGKFFINIHGDVIVKSNRKVKVDLTNFSSQNNSGEESIVDSEIKMTDDRGNIYLFGGNKNYLEYSGQLLNKPDYNLLENIKINAWYLKKIIYSNKKCIQFQYKILGEDLTLTTPKIDSYHYLITKILVNKSIGIQDWYYEGKSEQYFIYSVTKKCYLNRIIAEQDTIKFHYSKKDKLFYEEYEIDLAYNQKDLKVDSIVINSINQKKIADFKYTYLGREYERMFLKQISIGEKSYNLDYYAKGCKFPNPITTSIDHWGFWNGGNEFDYSKLCPRVIYNPLTLDYKYDGPNRAPNSVYCNVGMLKSIKNPYGGITSFEYESHDYSYRLDRTSASNFMPTLRNIEGICGGARIRSIITDNIKQRFIYKDSLKSKSSGELLQWPVYHSRWRTDEFIIKNDCPIKIPFLNRTMRIPPLDVSYSNSTNIVNYNYDDNYIVYKTVYVVNNDKIQKLNRYLSYSEKPDSFNYEIKSNIKVNNSYYNSLMKSNSKSHERGKLDEEVLFDEGVMVKKIKYYYKNINVSNNKKFDYYLSYPSIGRMTFPYKIFTLVNKLEHIVETSFSSSNSSSKISYFNYNDIGQLSEKKSINSDGSEIIETIKYVNDSSQPYDFTDPVSQEMVKRNMLFPVQTETFISKSGQKTQIGGTRTKYKFHHEYGNKTLIVKDKEYSWEPDKNYVEKIRYDQYDYYGNLLQYTHTPTGIATSYKWGYNYQYPILKAVNANYSDINRYTVGAAVPKIEGAQISTYTYKPLVGMTSQTDPNGNTTYYEYDDFNRLKTVKNSDHHILNKYTYHYQSQDEEKFKLDSSNYKISVGQYEFTVSPKTKISELRAALAEKLQVVLHRVQIKKSGVLVEDSKSLEQYGINQSYKLEYEIVQEFSMRISVKTITGKTINLEVKNTDLVEDLKQKIEDKEGISPTQQRLLFQGHQLEEGHALFEYGIAKDNLLYLVLGLI